MSRLLHTNHRKLVRSLWTCLLLAGTCTFLTLLMINLLADNGKTAIKLDRMAAISKPIQAKGIENSGAICFASSVAQMLFRIDGIRNFILNLDEENHELPPHQSQPVLGLKNLFKSLNDPEVKVVKGHGGRFIPNQFPRGDQGDADEFYSTWMELLETVMGPELRSELFLQVALNRTRTDTTGTTSNSTISSDSWSSIKVTFPDNNPKLNPIPLETLLNRENGPFGIETINPTLKQEYKIASVSKFLALSFVRTAFVRNGPVKITSSVQIPEFLNLIPFFSVRNSEIIKPLRLKMFVLHRGSAERGHYVAYVQDTEEVWHLIDDDKVKQVSKLEALEASKFSSICFYKRE